MSLIACKECGGDDQQGKGKTCPQWGPVRYSSLYTRIVVIVIGLAIINFLSQKKAVPVVQKAPW